LQRNILRALQLNVFEDPRYPDNILEMYTFTFRYSDSLLGVREVEGVDVTGPHGTTVTLKNAKYAMQMFIRRMIALCGTLPDLPRKRYLNMHLFYTDECAADYHPPGFQMARDDEIFFPNAEWKKSTAKCGEMNAGFHIVSLNVSHLHFTPIGYGDKTDLVLPNNLVYNQRASRCDDIDDLPRGPDLTVLEEPPTKNPLDKSNAEPHESRRDGRKELLHEHTTSFAEEDQPPSSNHDRRSLSLEKGASDLPSLFNMSNNSIADSTSEHDEGNASLPPHNAELQRADSRPRGESILCSDDVRMKRRLQQMVCQPPNTLQSHHSKIWLFCGTLNIRYRVC
jgi:hypothetical protein